MQQRDTTKSNREQGLYERYRVERIDGREDGPDPEYFILRVDGLTWDKPETAALRAYIAATAPTHPKLAADLGYYLRDMPGTPPDPDVFERALQILGFGNEFCSTADPVKYAEKWLAARLSEDLARENLTRALMTLGFDPKSAVSPQDFIKELVEAPKERSNREEALARLQAALDKAPLAWDRCPDGVYAELLDAGQAAASALRVPLWIAKRAGQVGPAEREELEDLRVRIAVVWDQNSALGNQLDQIVELVHTPEPPVEGKDHSWKAPDPVDLVRAFVERRADLLPPVLLTRAAAVAHALEQGNADVARMPIDEENEVYGEETVVETAVKVLRDIIDAVDKQPELVDARFVDVSYMSDPDRTVLRFEGLPDVAVPDADVDTLVSEYMAKSPVRAARVMMQQSTARAPRLPYYLPASTRTEVHGATGDGMVVITTSGTGEIAQVTCHDVGPEPEVEVEDDDDSLAERCKVASNNLSTLLGPIGGEGPVPEPLWSGVVTASVLLDEVADTLRLRDRKWWVIEDMSDGRDERATIYAIPHDDGPRDAALQRWAMSLEIIIADEQDRDPRDDVFDTAIDTLAFRPEHTVAWLEQHPGELYFVQPAGAAKLVEAIEALGEGESLLLEDGAVMTTYKDSDEREVRELFRLLDFCDGDEGVRTQLGAHHYPDDMALDEEEAEDTATRAAENAADHEAFARETDPPPLQQTLSAHYWQAGWGLGAQVDKSSTHLLDSRDGHRGEGAAACGDLVKVYFLKPLSDALDFPEHPRLCGRCCAAANDRLPAG